MHKYMIAVIPGDGRFSNTEFSKQFLSKDSPDYTGFIMMHHHHLMASWAKMPASVLSGKPNRSDVKIFK